MCFCLAIHFRLLGPCHCLALFCHPIVFACSVLDPWFNCCILSWTVATPLIRFTFVCLFSILQWNCISMFLVVSHRGSWYNLLPTLHVALYFLHFPGVTQFAENRLGLLLWCKTTTHSSNNGIGSKKPSLQKMPYTVSSLFKGWPSFYSLVYFSIRLKTVSNMIYLINSIKLDDAVHYGSVNEVSVCEMWLSLV